MQYMRAHGNTPGPTHRPYSTGALSGAIAAIPYVAILSVTGTLARSATGLGLSSWYIGAGAAAVMPLAGVLYAAIFRRAANDRAGGWLFGMSYGFLLWLLGPVTVWQLVTPEPFITGMAAIGSFGGHVAFGLVLGTLFPHVHNVIQQRLGHMPALPEKGNPDKNE